MDVIAENEDWEEEHPRTHSVPFDTWLNHRNHLDTTDSPEVMSRGSSICTDTAGRAGRLATLIQAMGLEFAIGPVIEASGPWICQAPFIDRSHAHDILF